MNPTRESKYRSTATNMVAIVDNTIEGYNMGPMRALAQEPVQNSKDAALTKKQTVKVVFELHERPLQDGRTAHMLTVTDSGTKGLGGPILDPDELGDQGSVLEPGHDWTAFEGHGYTKREESALGSRGQGKAALLYHSKPPNGPNGARRMVIVYDTLLLDGQYRLGVRYANPSDRTQSHPYLDHEARRIISAPDFVIDDNLSFPISLEPLTEAGTRIIIPFLNPETCDAIREGELAQWLQMCWWRSIQVGQLEIDVADGATRSSIGVPEWWIDEPWNQTFNETEMFYRENIPIPNESGMSIKRIAVTCNERIPKHNSLSMSNRSEFDGIQLLRGGQWITTLGKGEDWFIDKVPSEQNLRLRGFVEFEKSLDQELRDHRYEKPQHDEFVRRTNLVKGIIEQVGSCVAEFSENAGWSSSVEDPNRVAKKQHDVFRQVMELFTEPLDNGSGATEGQHGDPTKWRIQLDADYPNPGTTRVNWGQSLNNVLATCDVTPTPTFREATLKLAAIRPDGTETTIHQQNAEFDNDGHAVARFGQIPFLKGKAPAGVPYVGCELPGKYQLKVTVESANKRTVRANRSVFVQSDPPETRQNPITLKVLATNAVDPMRSRINSGEPLQVGISILNRSVRSMNLIVDASIIASEVPGHLVPGIDTPGSVPLLSGTNVTVNGVERMGETAAPFSVFNDRILLLDDLPSDPRKGFHIALAPGRHRLQVDVRDTHGNQIAHSGPAIWFEADPPSSRQGGLPFRLDPQSDQYESSGKANPDWWLERDSDPHLYKLCFSTNDPLYHAALKADFGTQGANPGTRAYLASICSDALLDWMLQPFLNGGNDVSRFEAIESRRQSGDKSWVYLASLMETFRDRCSNAEGDMLQDDESRRRIVANMVRVFAVHQ